MNDSDLRDLFTRERQRDAQRAPEFQHLLTRARAAAPCETVSWLRPALAFGAVVIVSLGVALWPAPKPRPSLANALPVLLPQQVQPSSLFVSLDQPATPSDFLLPHHSNFKVL